ncbi:hypothetical protein QTP86_009158 [Hemibagrus guttatus]|nr:hypothetical protein QTP86_009158 [Hemibagrus guttatus]
MVLAGAGPEAGGAGGGSRRAALVLEHHFQNPPLKNHMAVFIPSIKDFSKSEKNTQDMEHLDFKIVVEPKDSQSFTVILCIDNIRCNGLMMNAFEDNSKVTVPQMIKSDASLYCDDVDIRFSKMMNSCKVLQIRYASVERLLERLTDLRFLSIDFLNTFLHSYRVFTTADVVLDKLIAIYKRPISAIPARGLHSESSLSTYPYLLHPQHLHP